MGSLGEAARPVVADPGEVGLSAERLARIGAFLDAEIARDRLPGAVIGVIRHGRLVHLEAVGYRDRDRGVAMTTDSLFWIASMTKPVTAAGALMLHEEGRLALDAELGEYLPPFADRRVADLGSTSPGQSSVVTREAARQPTILDLMRHTAGIVEGYLGRTPVHAMYVDAVGDGMTDLTAAEFADRLSTLPLLFDPGTAWHYGWGFDLLGMIIESTVGTTLGAYLGERLFAPLGMVDTTFGVPAGRATRVAVALPNDPVTGDRQELPDLSIARFQSGGAGLVSTATDYLRFVQLLLDRGNAGSTRLLGRKTVEYMTSDQLDPTTDTSRLERAGWNPGYGFGLGLAVRRRLGGGSGPGSVGELTWPGAAGTTWWADPREGLGVVFLTHTPSRIQTRYHHLIKTLVLQSIVD